MVNRVEASTAVLRVVLGITFFIHGFVKFQGGIENIVGWFESIGLPGFLAYGVGILEVVGGAALIIGLGTKVVSVLFVIMMVGAIFSAKLAGGFLGNGQGAGYELDVALLAIAIFTAVNGSKMLSVDQLIFKGRNQNNFQAS